MKIGIICGSHRNPSQSEKVANHISQQLTDLGQDPWLFTLADNPLPLWDQSIWEGSQDWIDLLNPIKQQLAACDGLVIISPEWHGQVPSGLKNFFLLFSKMELGHKPALITAVSAGDGGAYPVAELRMSSYKNNRLCYIPEHLIIRHVESILNQDESLNNSQSDQYYRERIKWTLQVLIGYADALKTMRDNTPVFHDKFGNGM